MYAKGDGVPCDDSKAYHYFNVEDYDEDQPDRRDVSAISDAFVAVGVYCLNGIPNSDVWPDPQRAHELFQYAATTFADPNAQYNLAHIYMIGGGGFTKDNVAAVRRLALAVKAGHPPSQSFTGTHALRWQCRAGQRGRGLMWLELAKDGAPSPKGQWIRDLYQRDFRDASDTERLAAASMRDARTKGTSSPLAARSSVRSFLQPFGVILATVWRCPCRSMTEVSALASATLAYANFAKAISIGLRSGLARQSEDNDPGHLELSTTDPPLSPTPPES
jgi:hypothetical protein